MAKQKANLTALGQIQSDTQSAYVSAPLIEAPFSTIFDLQDNARQIRDPEQTLRLSQGIERIPINGLKLLTNEKGVNGEQVYSLDSGDDRIRIVNTWNFVSDVDGTYINSSDSIDYLEVTFFGTGLHILNRPDNLLVGVGVSVDGGVESTVNIALQSLVLQNKNFRANVVVPLVNDLALGVHTVKVRRLSNSLYISGFEIINESASIHISKGEVVSGGQKSAISASTTTAYNSGFDGSPSLNGRGGRVVVYQKYGYIGKVIQQTNASQANLLLADHSNEEVIRRINFREFGVNRADDFSTLAAVTSDRAFVLDDGNTNLIGNDVQVQTENGIEAVRPFVDQGFITFSFVGTGLDILLSTGPTVTDQYDIYIDGTNVGTLSEAADTIRTYKIVSGLPYGTHSVRIFRVGGTNHEQSLVDCIVYGPKKPSIPDRAVEIGEYYLMANYVPNTVAGIETTATGILRKVSTREMTYVGTWNFALAVTGVVGGFNITSTTTTNYQEYTFFGTGFEFRPNSSTANTFTISVDGSTNLSGFTTGTYGTGIAFTGTNPATVNLTVSTAGYGGFVYNLPLGIHTVRFTKTAGAGGHGINAFDIITPIHFPNSKRGSLSLNPDLLALPNANELGNVDLSKAKAWLEYDTALNTIVSSYNVSAVFQISTSNIIVYFDKPFKNDAVVVASGSNTNMVVRGLDNNTSGQTSKKSGVAISTASATNRFIVVAFGELMNEE